MPRSIRMLVALACAACGAQERPGAVTAWREGGRIEVRWTGPAIRVAAASLDGRSAVGEEIPARGNAASLPDDPRADGVWVESGKGRSIGFVSAGPEGGSGAVWQVFAPHDVRDGALRASFPRLDPGERLGVLLVNAGGKDGAEAAVEISGTAAPEADVPAPPDRRAAVLVASAASDLHEVVREAQALEIQRAVATARPAAAEAAPEGDRRSFCVVRGLDFSTRVRKPATRAISTAHADVFVDDDDLPRYADLPAFLPTLAQVFEQRVQPAVWGAFGAPTDIDGNGKILVLITHELGVHLNGGWLIGYFGNGDLLRERDGSGDCGGTGSNHGEIVYLNDVSNGAANGYSAEELASSVLPATLAHELQHLVNLGSRCVARKCDGPEETWINEALSKVSEDLAGFGWNDARGRGEGAQYLTHGSGALLGYDRRSLTLWEGDPIGNYQGAHSFLRFFADRLGADLPRRVLEGSGGKGALEDALGRPLPRAMAEWATALLLSNETRAPWSYSGTAWSPLHQRLRHLEYDRLGGATRVVLRTDGIAALVSGAGQGGPVEVRVRSGERVAPHAVVVRISGSLPR